MLIFHQTDLSTIFAYSRGGPRFNPGAIYIVLFSFLYSNTVIPCWYYKLKRCSKNVVNNEDRSTKVMKTKFKGIMRKWIVLKNTKKHIHTIWTLRINRLLLTVCVFPVTDLYISSIYIEHIYDNLCWLIQRDENTRLYKTRPRYFKSLLM